MVESDSELKQSYESDDSEYNLSQHTKSKLRKRRLIINEHSCVVNVDFVLYDASFSDFLCNSRIGNKFRHYANIK